MTCSSHAITHALQQLERRVLDLRRYTRALIDAPPDGQLAASVAAVHGTRQSLDGIAAAMLELRRQVVSQDGLGGPIGSTGELVLRAARLVFLREIDRLAVDAVEWAESSPGWSACAMDARVVLRAQLDRMTVLWLPHRSPEVGQRSVLYREAVRAALRAQQTLGQHPALRELLRAGIALSDDRHVIEPYEQILAVLGLDLDLYLGSSPGLPIAHARVEQVFTFTYPGEP
jgi:hypothetical protein